MLSGYENLENGLIKQQGIFKKIQEYNVEYIKQRYDSYGELSRRMGYLRLGYLLGSLPHITINSILDVGYGNGDFLKAAVDIIPHCYGSEVNNYNLPEGCKYENSLYDKNYDVVCFFDVLEHFEDIYEIKQLKTNYIYISVPECHYIDDLWSDNWKHRRPDEHLWHFNKKSLINFMDEIGYKCVITSNIEDTIRKSTNGYSNIITGIFKKYDI